MWPYPPLALKVDTVRRICFKKLPKVLVIQLKRFDYDLVKYVCTLDTCTVILSTCMHDLCVGR